MKNFIIIRLQCLVLGLLCLTVGLIAPEWFGVRLDELFDEDDIRNRPFN